MILDLQQRARELGRIRLGQKGDRGQPEKLDHLRITSASKALVEKVAALYGGTVKPWTPKAGAGQYEVIITATRVPILVPPQPITQWMETWTGGGCVHRCDGVTEMITGDPCDPADPDHVNAKPTTRLNVILRDVEGLGVFRLESHGWNAAAELPMAAMFLAAVGGYVEAHLGIEERTSKKITDGRSQTLRYMVPVIEVDVTPAQLLAGGNAVAQITHQTPERAQIEAPPKDWAAQIAAAATVDDLRGLWPQIRADLGAVPEPLVATFQARLADLQNTPETGQNGPLPDAPASGAPEAAMDEDVPQNLGDAWNACLAVAGRFDPPWSLPETVQEFADWYAERNGGVSRTADDASYTDLIGYRDHLRSLVDRVPV